MKDTLCKKCGNYMYEAWIIGKYRDDEYQDIHSYPEYICPRCGSHAEPVFGKSVKLGKIYDGVGMSTMRAFTVDIKKNRLYSFGMYKTTPILRETWL